MEINFSTKEYTSEDSFQDTEYRFKGSAEDGWVIERNRSHYLTLDKGYRLLKTKVCGVCSTDLDRRFLPFPLPQIIGHEVIAEDVESGEKFAVEINDTDAAKGKKPEDIFCTSGIPTHQPDRMVLGIDRLPGGFGPYILSPVNAAVPIGNVPEMTAVLTEPFAAALQAVIASPPVNGTEVAVLGPRRLGSLLIAALNAYRNSSGKNFKIAALARHSHLLELASELGADILYDLRTAPKKELQRRFSIVYDTTANPEGFLTAMEYSSAEVHLKSTNGQTVSGLKKMTEAVVDELSILPFSEENLHFSWDSPKVRNERIYIADSKFEHPSLKSFRTYRKTPTEAFDLIRSDEFAGRLPRFDLCIASSLQDIDSVIRPKTDSEESLLRPRGAVLFTGKTDGNPLLDFLMKGGRIRTSRCGDFHLALKLLSENPVLAEKMRERMITHEFSSGEIEKAFAQAKESSSVKVIVRQNG